MFGKQFFLVLATLVFAFIVQGNPIYALSPADKNWADLEQRGTAALDSNEYGKAESLLKKALVQAKEFRPSDMRLAKSIAELGRLYTIRGQFSRAALYLETELKVKELLSGNKQYQCIPTMGSLIQFYFKYDMQNKAIPLTKKMLALIDNRLKTPPLVPMIEWATICDTVGDRFHTVHNLVFADRLFKTSLSIKTILLPHNHLSLAYSYERIGSLDMERNEPTKAEQYFANEVKITEKILPPESHEVYASTDKLAKCLISQKKYEAAEKLYLHAKNCCIEGHAKPEDTASMLFALGCLYTEEHKYKLALSCFQQALQLAKQCNGSNSIALSAYLEKIDLAKSAQRQASLKQPLIETSQESASHATNSMLVAKKSEKSTSHQLY